MSKKNLKSFYQGGPFGLVQDKKLLYANTVKIHKVFLHGPQDILCDIFFTILLKETERQKEMLNV